MIVALVQILHFLKRASVGCQQERSKLSGQNDRRFPHFRDCLQ
jgi:hypothetical protein